MSIESTAFGPITNRSESVARGVILRASVYVISKQTLGGGGLSDVKIASGSTECWKSLRCINT